ncbi:L-lactate permease [Geobacillus sp. 46C-IIa]|uniref:L-lactate permease n=1 Tax=Geobacillus sp. 46C-IIa TaxID=1963025 RepID=UPI001301F707|nr:L-lactate permease [Geobacillus sp. 46C-IIa]QNU27293.1 L-lactate permease [Geobacillus sp. 46C-IIa]
MGDAIRWLLAALPLLWALAAIGWRKMSAMNAALGCYALAVGLALFPFHASAGEVMHFTMYGVLLALIVVYVLVFGLLLHHVLEAGGAIRTLSAWLSYFGRTKSQQALLVSAALGPFLEAVSGFGLAVVITAPLYTALGFPARKAMTLALLTQSAVPWGALAIGTVINAELSGVPLRELGEYSAWLHIPLYLFYACAVVVISGGWRSIRMHLGDIVIVFVSLALVTWAVSAYVSVELAGAAAGGTAALVLIGYWQCQAYFGRRKEEAEEREEREERQPLGKVLWPYLVLIGYIFITHFFPEVRHIATTVGVWQWPAYGFRLELLYSPGFALCLAVIVAFGLYRLRLNEGLACIRKTLKQVFPAAVATTGFIAMSSVMDGSGMMGVLATQAATWTESAFLAVSPLVGALGGWTSGSNSAANAMFSPFQRAMADQLHEPAIWYAAAQNVAASNMTMASPARIALVASTVGRPGEEGEAMRLVGPIAGAALVIIVLGVLIGRATVGM